ncbi:conserved protein of unknown function [Modestobacter italicus]|uniref:Uncharacterized protein n=1 Tax=Modestobacter italicus (strain DSM 44449 / CECT 9708 / BC 501) TaxID=2732864 RepID=I4EZW6_MODI5|nr:hypothetical protein [Modestobacter marinus]CCH88929.1 conserved protein of unknown function [Modestobacter marinus]
MTTPGPDWVEQARRFAAGLAAEHAGGAGFSDLLGGSTGAAERAAECRSCPLCAGLAALRGHRPDLLEALADVLTSAATALRSTARPTTDGGAAAPAPDPTAPPEETVPHPAPAPTVQRIDVA